MGEQARGPSGSTGLKASVLISLLVFQPAPAGDLGPSAAVATHRSSPWLLPAHPYSPVGLWGCASPPSCPPSPAFAPRAHLHLRRDLSIQAHPLGWPLRAKPPRGCVPCTWAREAFGERGAGPLDKDPWKAAGGSSSWQNHLGTDVPSCCCRGASYLVILNIQIG